MDTLILALLSYLRLSGIVPGIESREEITLKEAAGLYFAKSPQVKKKKPQKNATVVSSFDLELENLFSTAAGCPRFADIHLSRFEENTDYVIGRQFAALTFAFRNPGPKKVIAFRGTDNSVAGWKEDFKLAYMQQIPAQKSALKYLRRTIGIFSSRFIVCGHSKGGNLALYAGVHLNGLRQLKLKRIINFDGPGFDFSIVRQDPFKQSEHKIINYVPEESMVGILLDSVGARSVVASSSRFFLQHNAFNWGVEHDGFVQGALSNNAVILERSLKTWLSAISIPERETCLEALFDILGAADEATISLDPQESLQILKNIMKNYAELDEETKAVLTEVFESLSAEAKHILSKSIKERLPKIPFVDKQA